MTCSLVAPSSIRISSTKSESSLSVNNFLDNTADILNLSAPGAVSFEYPFALSNKSEFTDEADNNSSLIDNPIL